MGWVMLEVEDPGYYRQIGNPRQLSFGELYFDGGIFSWPFAAKSAMLRIPVQKICDASQEVELAAARMAEFLACRKQAEPFRTGYIDQDGHLTSQYASDLATLAEAYVAKHLGTSPFGATHGPESEKSFRT